jgi:hypothetical protein
MRPGLNPAGMTLFTCFDDAIGCLRLVENGLTLQIDSKNSMAESRESTVTPVCFLAEAH